VLLVCILLEASLLGLLQRLQDLCVQEGNMMDNLRQMLVMMSPEEFRAAARERELEEWRGINS
jgi:hypothetical protein